MTKTDEMEGYPNVAHQLYSHHLDSFRAVHVYLPPSYGHEDRAYPVMYVNDGQDMARLRLKENLQALYARGIIAELVVVAIPAVHRLEDYGTAGIPDYAHRGGKADKYTRFVIDELMPFVNASYRTLKMAQSTAFIGFSLGALSALDISWNNPHHFGMVGVFSGALWWRLKSLTEGYTDDDRIMHHIIRTSEKREGMRFWLEAGTEDEKDDRNNNGIIDAIDDTLDLMNELEGKGYVCNEDFAYLEVPGGQHNFGTWREVLPNFLQWAYGLRRWEYA